MTPLAIPRTCDARAAKVLVQIESQAGLGEQQGSELLKWLRETDFDTDTYWIGELAARLIHDRGAAELKTLVKEACSGASDWQLYFFLIALRDEVGWEPFDGFIESARQSQRSVIRAFAEALWQESHATSGSGVETSG